MKRSISYLNGQGKGHTTKASEGSRLPFSLFFNWYLLNFFALVYEIISSHFSIACLLYVKVWIFFLYIFNFKLIFTLQVYNAAIFAFLSASVSFNCLKLQFYCDTYIFKSTRFTKRCFIRKHDTYLAFNYSGDEEITKFQLCNCSGKDKMKDFRWHVWFRGRRKFKESITDSRPVQTTRNRTAKKTSWAIISSPKSSYWTGSLDSPKH